MLSWNGKPDGQTDRRTDGQVAPPVPKRLGITEFSDYSLDELANYIDWSPFFQTWELRGHYPAILDDKLVGKEARKLLDDAQRLLDRIIKDKILTAKGVFGLFPANSHGDDIELAERRVVLHHLRQQQEKPPGRANLCLADFVASKASGIRDYVGAFAVTTGLGTDEFANEFVKKHDDYNSIMAKALADRLAEAFAERLHQRVRQEFWGYAKQERLGNEELIKEQYVGIRPAPGYPACPDHTEKRTLFELLDVTRRTGITLTENYAMWPAASVSGWYFSHPDSIYFGVGKIGKDQVEDYAGRKGLSVAETERWLAPNLAYSRE